MIRAVLVAVALCATAAVAHAYPQFQISKEQTCTACHIAPAGGGLLDAAGMGPLTAEDNATWATNPGLLYGALDLPEWLFLGGEFRSAIGAHNHGEGTTKLAFIPMQYEVHAAARAGNLTFYATVGFAPPKEDKLSNAVHAREHWAMYRSGDGGAPGIYVRAGRFMPVYGLRYAEHVIYTRRFGGTPLYGETYGLSAGYLSPGLEVHLTGFVRDRLRDDFAIERGDGAAVFAEKRITEKLAFGAEARYAKSPDETRMQGGLTAKTWIPGAHLQLAFEAQLIRQKFDAGGTRRTQVVAYGLASWQRLKGIMIDLGVGHFDEDTAISGVDRDCVDLNVHWFVESHVELLLTSRYQMIQDGDPSFFSLLQVHFRL